MSLQQQWNSRIFLSTLVVLLLLPGNAPTAASAEQPTMALPVVPAGHHCDALGDAGWRVVATREIAQVVDSPARHDAGSDDWWIDRQITVLPFCNYYNKVGNYSLRSYSLSPETLMQSVRICEGNNALPPYRGDCPPKSLPR